MDEMSVFGLTHRRGADAPRPANPAVAAARPIVPLGRSRVRGGSAWDVSAMNAPTSGSEPGESLLGQEEIFEVGSEPLPAQLTHSSLFWISPDNPVRQFGLRFYEHPCAFSPHSHMASSHISPSASMFFFFRFFCRAVLARRSAHFSIWRRW